MYRIGRKERYVHFIMNERKKRIVFAQEKRSTHITDGTCNLQYTDLMLNAYFLFIVHSFITCSTTVYFKYSPFSMFNEKSLKCKSDFLTVHALHLITSKYVYWYCSKEYFLRGGLLRFHYS
jgi:hypothetical protein